MDCGLTTLIGCVEIVNVVQRSTRGCRGGAVAEPGLQAQDGEQI